MTLIVFHFFPSKIFNINPPKEIIVRSNTLNIDIDSNNVLIIKSRFISYNNQK